MASEKTKVIEHLFFKYWDEKTQKLKKTKAFQGNGF